MITDAKLSELTEETIIKDGRLFTREEQFELIEHVHEVRKQRDDTLKLFSEVIGRFVPITNGDVLFLEVGENLRAFQVEMVMKTLKSQLAEAGKHVVVICVNDNYPADLKVLPTGTIDKFMAELQRVKEIRNAAAPSSEVQAG